MSSSSVVLSAAFLALAAGGAAACDAAAEEDDGYSFSEPATYSDSGDPDVDAAPIVDDEEYGEEDVEEDVEEPAPEVFYCADEQGEVVDEDRCDVDDATTSYLLWHSPTYPRGLRPGTFLDGGDFISAGDREARRAFRLPATGTIANGTVKTNVVGRGSVGSGAVGGDSAGG